MKIRKMFMTVAAAAVLLTGCGGVDTAAVEALLSQAQETMATVDSMAAEMTMEMDMGMNGEIMETTTVANIRSQQNPMKMAMEMSMLMHDGSKVDQMEMYAAEEDGHLHTYMHMADTWYAETLELGELNQYNAEENTALYLDNITDVKSAEKEEVNGTELIRDSSHLL